MMKIVHDRLELWWMTHGSTWVGRLLLVSLIVAGLLWYGVAFATDWILRGENQDAEIYLDPETLIFTDVGAIYWEKLLYKTPPQYLNAKLSYILNRVSANCRGGTFMLLETIFYSTEGQVLYHTRPEIKQWEGVPPGTLASSVFEFVCKLYSQK